MAASAASSAPARIAVRSRLRSSSFAARA